MVGVDRRTDHMNEDPGWPRGKWCGAVNLPSAEILKEGLERMEENL